MRLACFCVSRLLRCSAMRSSRLLLSAASAAMAAGVQGVRRTELGRRVDGGGTLCGCHKREEAHWVAPIRVCVPFPHALRGGGLFAFHI